MAHSKLLGGVYAAFVKDNWSLVSDRTARLFSGAFRESVHRKRILARLEPLETRQLLTTVTSLVLYNADTNRQVATLSNGSTINYAQLGTNHISIVADTDGSTRSVVFGVDSNSKFHVEGSAPYSINGDNNGDLNSWTPSLGSHTITATPYTGTYGTGIAGSADRISINVINQSTSSGGSTTNVSGNVITSLVVYNADTNKPVQTLTNGSTINFAQIGTNHISIVADAGSGTRSVIFGYDSNSKYHVEGSAPYAISGDNNGDLNSWTPSLGSHTVKATPYSGSYGSGTAGGTYSVSFNVTNSSSSGSTGGGTLDSNTAGSPKVVISAVETNITAGHAVFVNGLSSTLGAGSPITAKYNWDFGNSGSEYNTLTGWNAAHVYDNPGTYTVRLTITNQNHQTSTGAMTINVASANRRVIYVSAAGSDSNNGSYNSPYRTFDKAASMVTDNMEILFRDGDTFTTGSSMSLAGHHNVLVGSYGSGNKPVIRYTGPLMLGATIFLTGGGSDGITIQNVTLDSIYTNSSTYEGMPIGIGVGGVNTTVRDVQFLNVSDAVNANRQPKGLLVEDSTAPNGVRGYFAWVQGSDQAYIGNSCANSIYQHDLRDGGADRILIADNNFTNNYNAGNVIKGTLTIHKGTYVYITGNTLNTGTLGIGPLGDGDGLDDKGARLDYVVAEANRITGLTSVVTGAEHIMLRNNIMIRPHDVAIDVEGYSSTYGRGVVDLNIVNNTVVNTASYGNFLRVEGPVNTINLINNLYLAPNLLTGPMGAAPVFVYSSDLSSFGTITNNVWCNPHLGSYAQGGINYVWPYWSNSSGYRTPAEWQAFSQVQTDYYENPSYSSNYAPSSSSKTATAGIQWSGEFTDFYGNARPTSGSLTAGAVQV